MGGRVGICVERQYLACSGGVLALKRPTATICFWLASDSQGGAWRLFSMSEKEGSSGGSVVCVGGFACGLETGWGEGLRLRDFEVCLGLAVA